MVWLLKLVGTFVLAVGAGGAVWFKLCIAADEKAKNDGKTKLEFSDHLIACLAGAAASGVIFGVCNGPSLTAGGIAAAVSFFAYFSIA